MNQTKRINQIMLNHKQHSCQKDFKITKQEFEDFCKGFLFEQIKGDLKLGDTFCKKYNESNYVLSILPDDSAREHIRKFYVK